MLQRYSESRMQKVGKKSRFLFPVKDLTISPEEANGLEHKVRVALRSLTAKISSYKIVSNPELQKKFNEKVSGGLVVETWINMDRFPYGEETIAVSGFSVGPTGMDVSSGTMLPFQLTDGSSTHTFCLCKVGVGRSFCVPEALKRKEDDSTDTYLRPPKAILPKGFDSILLPDFSGDDDAHPISHINNMHYEYTVFDSDRILPLSFITFEYNVENDSRAHLPICANCDEEVATSYCEQCTAKLCRRCDLLCHPTGNKVLTCHRRGPLKEKDKGLCPFHPHMTVEFFCPSCATPVCVQCKMTGNHSSGECGNHKLIGMQAAYNKSLKEATNETKSKFNEKEKLLQIELDGVQRRMKNVRENAKEVEEQLYSRFVAALLQLRMEVDVKTGILKADELEVRRQIQSMKLYSQFLDYVKDELSLLPFISAWNVHRKELSVVSSLEGISRPADVIADLKAIGRLDVERLEEGETREEYDGHDLFASENIPGNNNSTPSSRHRHHPKSLINRDGTGMSQSQQQQQQQPEASTPFRKLVFGYTPPSPITSEVIVNSEAFHTLISEVEAKVPPRVSSLHLDEEIPFVYSAGSVNSPFINKKK